MISSQVKDCNRQPIAYVRELKHEEATQTWGRAYEYQILALNKSVTARTQVTPAACRLHATVSDDPGASRPARACVRLSHRKLPHGFRRQAGLGMDLSLRIVSEQDIELLALIDRPS